MSVDYEALFQLPVIDWSQRRSISQYWIIRDTLNEQRALVENMH